MQAMISAKCEKCGKAFERAKRRTRPGRPMYCCRRCAMSAIGKLATSSHYASGAANPSWKGGISKDRMRYKRLDVQRHPEKVKAREKVRSRVRRGAMVPKPCARCGSTRKLEAHHSDYSKPYDVEWLCLKCHKKEHAAQKQ